MCVYCNLVPYLLFCFDVNVSLNIIRNLKQLCKEGCITTLIANVNLKHVYSLWWPLTGQDACAHKPVYWTGFWKQLQGLNNVIRAQNTTHLIKNNTYSNVQKCSIIYSMFPFIFTLSYGSL